MKFPQVDPNINGKLIFLKGTNEIHWRKDSLLTYGTRSTGYLYAVNFNSYLLQYIKIYSKWIRDLNVKPKRKQHRIFVTWFWQIFLNYDTKNKAHKRNDKWDFKVKHIYFLKE